MGLTTVFTDLVEGMKLKSEVHAARKLLEKAVDAGDTSQVESQLHNMRQTVRDAICERDSTEKIPLAGRALQNGHNAIFKTLMKRLPGQTRMMAWHERVNDRTVDVLQKSLLYFAIQQKNVDAALFLMDREDTDIEQGGWRHRNDSLIWQETPIQAARSAGLIGVTITLAEKLGVRRRDEARRIFDGKVSEAMVYENEAAELRKLNLVDGVYRLPEPYTPHKMP